MNVWVVLYSDRSGIAKVFEHESLAKLYVTWSGSGIIEQYEVTTHPLLNKDFQGMRIKIFEGTDDNIINRFTVSVLNLTKKQAEEIHRNLSHKLADKLVDTSPQESTEARNP